MTEEEFIALLKLEGKTLSVGKADEQGLMYMASVIVSKNIIHNYAYDTTREGTVQKLIKQHYANNR